MNKLKVGIIGCGTIATSAHIPAYLADGTSEIAWFCDIIEERATAQLEHYPNAKVTTDYHEVLADPEIDAISVCTPNTLHSEISIAALAAGKHVLCEKPAAYNYSEAYKMYEARQGSDKILNIGVVNRFNDSVRAIKDLIDQGELGEVYHVYASFRAHRSIPGLGGAFTTKAIAGGGALIDWGVHYIDIVMYCTGDPKPKTVSAETFSKLGVDMKNYVYEDMWAGPPNYEGTYDVDDSVIALARTEGPVISVHGAWAQNINQREAFIDFMGTKGGVRLDYGGAYTFYGTEDGKLIERRSEDPKTHMFNNEIADFLACIREGRTNAADINNAIVTSRLMQAIYDSAETHREIVLD